MSNDTKKAMRIMRSASWVSLLVCLISPVLLAQAISDIRIVTPRDFGYTIGDKVRHEMHLSLADPYRLDTASLPTTGRLNRWLEVSRAEARVEHRNKQLTYHIVIDYQILNAPRKLTAITIPQLEFVTTGATNSIPVFFPEWTFTIGPITRADAGEVIKLHPDRAPQPIPVVSRRVRLVIATLLLAGLLLYSVYHRFVLPRLERGRYPFSKALADLRKLQRSDADPENYRLGLKAFHEAMNATAGSVVFAANLQDFLAANGKFTDLKAELAALYARSQDIFFNNAEVGESATSLQELVDLCRQCRRLERTVT